MYHEKATRTVMDRSFPVRIRNDPAVLRVLGSSHRADCKYKKYIEREDETENKEENKDE